MYGCKFDYCPFYISINRLTSTENLDVCPVSGINSLYEVSNITRVIWIKLFLKGIFYDEKEQYMVL